jgi:hypothetical protein
MSDLRALKKNLDSRLSSSALRKILTKDNDPSKIKSLYLKFYTDKKLDTSKPLTEIFKDLRTTKLSRNKLALYDKFVREDKTPPDYINSINEIVKSINIPNPENFMEKLSYLQESSEWANKIDSIKIEEEKPKLPTQEEEKMGMVQEEIETLEAEAAASQSEPAKKPEKPKASYPPRLRKKPKVEASKPKPPTIDKSKDEEPISEMERSKAKVKSAEEKLQQTIDEIPEPEQPQMADPIPEKPISLTSKKKKPKVVETEVKTGLEDIPSKIDLIPPERLSAEFKSAKELESDIQYFFKTFPKQLATIKKNYQKAKKTPEYLKRTHKRIVALLRAGAKETKEKVGVIIEGSEFIKDKLREIYLEEINNGLTAEDLIMNVEQQEKDKNQDIGFYEIKKGASGKDHSQREPVYKSIPEGQPLELKGKSKPKRLAEIPTKYRSMYTYEKDKFDNNPFQEKQPRIILRKLY